MKKSSQVDLQLPTNLFSPGIQAIEIKGCQTPSIDKTTPFVPGQGQLH